MAGFQNRNHRAGQPKRAARVQTMVAGSTSPVNMPAFASNKTESKVLYGYRYDSVMILAHAALIVGTGTHH